MNWRCWFGHALSAPFAEHGRLKVRCVECAYVSNGIAVGAAAVRPIHERWDRTRTYWTTQHGQAWLNGTRTP